MPFFSKYRFLIIYISTFFLVIFWVSIIFASDLVFSPKVEVNSLSKNIYLNDIKLRNNIISFKSNYDISSYKIENTCIINSSFIGKKQDNYFFNFKYIQDCTDENIYLKSSTGNSVLGSHLKMNLFNEFDLWNLFTDLSDSDLEKFRTNLFLEIKKIQLIKSQDFFINLQNKRNIDEDIYKTKIIDKIIEARKQKYSIPVLGYKLPTNESKVPNSARPYRASYTFGIHEGWDIDAPVGTPVQALDDGIIIRIVSGFKFEDLQKINYKDTSFETKVLNLDILRGNQVWIKTSKGDIVFYSHLNKVSPDLKVGDLVSRGKYLGNVGITGVPDKNYKDSHLHFEVHKNPYILSKAGKYSFMDYMSLPWYFKGLGAKYVLEHQNLIFK